MSGRRRGSASWPGTSRPRPVAACCWWPSSMGGAGGRCGRCPRARRGCREGARSRPTLPALRAFRRFPDRNFTARAWTGCITRAMQGQGVSGRVRRGGGLVHLFHEGARNCLWRGRSRCSTDNRSTKPPRAGDGHSFQRCLGSPAVLSDPRSQPHPDRASRKVCVGRLA